MIMEKDKLEKAANAQTHFFNTNMTAESVPYDERFKKGFIRGVEWLMTKPLSERLTEEDVDNLNNIMFLMRGMAASHQISYGCLEQIANALYDVFGKDIFEKQRRYAVVNTDLFGKGIF